ncbi:SGNH/GDSL hydrolase family protein [Nonomuraea phyllanthi]|uniref:SGNH hydrolase domain-containing protein n=1 Tax=Nonomuraea phyllanthi TaxID=2219224 RepID=UPI001293EEF7|nr:SGNH hydrolase domain-containing protein [Nonomuraea phyllanthi]QFY10756.1 SGNH/GDSL hydrolase family protein [Nonomuraea phyllanthi]
MRSTNLSPGSSVSPGRRRAGAILALAAGIALAGCGTSTASSGDQPARTPGGGGVRVLWMGDSIAGAQAPALEAALEAGGAAFRNATSDGGGNVVAGDHPVTAKAAEDTWKTLKENLASFRPTVIAYQITSYDWGTAREQLSAYRRLAGAAADAGARLVLVSAPPFKIDDFFAPHEKAIRRAPAMAAKAAGAGFLDASELWGNDYAAGKAQRAEDGIHSCQQGSAAFATWFAKKLGGLTGFAPAAPGDWATGPWTGDERFVKLGCG